MREIGLSPHSLVIGRTLGHYVLREKLGTGGMGEVYLAEDTKLARNVALKVLPPELASSPDRRERFHREAKAVAALSHPNIVAIFDAGEHGDQLYVVTELLEGETLRDRLSRGAVPLRKAIDWTMQIADGIAAAKAGRPVGAEDGGEQRPVD